MADNLPSSTFQISHFDGLIIFSLFVSFSVLPQTYGQLFKTSLCRLLEITGHDHSKTSAQQRKSRDIIEFFKKAGENAIKAISGLIPGGKPTSQLTTQPRGPKIPLNTINEDAIKPVIPYKRNMIGKLKNGSVMKTNPDNLVLKVRKGRVGNKRMMKQQLKEPVKYKDNNINKNNNKR